MVRPWRISLLLLAYYLGLGLVFTLLQVTNPMAIPTGALAIFAYQMLYGLGGVSLAYFVSQARDITTWLERCGLVRTQVVYVVHAVVVGFGLRVIPRVLRGEELWLRGSTRFDVVWLYMLPAGFMEDLVLVGTLYPMFRAHYGVAGSLTIVGVVSAVAHGWSVEFTGFSLLSHMIGQIAFCLYREHTGSLWPASACHASANVTLLLLI